MIDQDVIERTLGAALRTGAEFAEIYAEDKRNTSVGLDDGRIEQVTSGRDRGAGIRVIKGDTTGFAHTSDLSESGLAVAAAAAAEAAARGGGGAVVVALTPHERRVVNEVKVHPETIAKAAKVELLQRIDEAARAAGSEIVQVSAGYADSRKRVLVANSDGLLAEDDIARVLGRINVVASGDSGMQTGFRSFGHTVGWELFDPASDLFIDVEQLAREAAQQALTKLTARPAPSGAMPVVIKNGSGAVLFHEACGHGLEADHIQKGASVYAGKVGELVASPLVTLVDDGTMAGEWGTIAIDDEGHATRRNVLIQDGVLQDYMWDHIAHATGRRVVAVSADTRDDAAVHAAMEEAAALLGGPIGILVNAAAEPAGFAKPPGITEIQGDYFHAELDTKVMGYIRCARELVPGMKALGWGRIVNISGLAARPDRQCGGQHAQRRRRGAHQEHGR